MESMIFATEQYYKFDIHKDCSHPTLEKFSFSRRDIKRIIKDSIFNQFYDVNGSYKYYLMRRMRNVDKWYNGNLFEILKSNILPYKNKVLFVRNKKNGRLDNVISQSFLEEIDYRVANDLSVYIVSDHAVERARERIYDLHNKSYYQIYNWFLDEVKRWHPCVLKEKYKIMALLNHHFESCNYYMDNNGRVYVVKDHCLMTVHYNESDRWVLK